MAISIQQGASLVILLLVIGVTLSVSARTSQSFSDSLSAGTAQNIANNVTAGTDQFGQQMGTINIIAAAAIIISLLYGGLMMGGKR